MIVKDVRGQRCFFLNNDNSVWIRKFWVVLIVIGSVNVFFVAYLINYDGLLLPKDNYGWVQRSGVFGGERIILSVPQGEEFSEYVLLHETGHVVYAHLNESLHDQWGGLHQDGFFVTDYASVSADEDFAESWAHYLLYRDLEGDKAAFIEKIIVNNMGG